MTFPSELTNQLSRFSFTVGLEEDSLKIYPPAGWSSWNDAPEEVRQLLRELKTNKQEVTCFLTWQSMLDRCNKAYRPGALQWARQHFPELVKSLFEAEQQYQTAYQQQDIEGCRQAAADWEATLKRICLLHELAEGGEVTAE